MNININTNRVNDIQRNEILTTSFILYEFQTTCHLIVSPANPICAPYICIPMFSIDISHSRKQQVVPTDFQKDRFSSKLLVNCCLCFAFYFIFSFFFYSLHRIGNLLFSSVCSFTLLHQPTGTQILLYILLSSFDWKKKKTEKIFLLFVSFDSSSSKFGMKKKKIIPYNVGGWNHILFLLLRTFAFLARAMSEIYLCISVIGIGRKTYDHFHAMTFSYWNILLFLIEPRERKRKKEKDTRKKE